MQWVGGSKGANDQYWLTLAGLASDALSLANSKEKALFEPYLKAGLIDQLNQLFFRLGGITEAGGNAHLVSSGSCYLVDELYSFRSSNPRRHANVIC